MAMYNNIKNVIIFVGEGGDFIMFEMMGNQIAHSKKKNLIKTFVLWDTSKLINMIIISI
jgi:hypothetical protein